MTVALIILAVLALVGLLTAELRHLVAGDGLGHRPRPRSHRDEQARELAAWTH